MGTVLLVDDDHICNFLMAKALEKLGVAKEILTVLNGKQAIDLIRDYTTNLQNLPEVIFLDINMPIMDGFAFLEAYNDLDTRNKKDIKIIVVSSSDSPSDKLKAESLGAKDFLSKPITEDKLKLILQSS